MAQPPIQWLAVLALGAISCGATATDEGWSSASSPVIGGKVAAVCEWPTTVLFASAGCSGTLVHPRVVTVAKHCLDSTPSTVSFGEGQGNKIAKTARVAKCFKHPQTDFAFCTLAEDVVGIPIVPVMAPCEQNELKVGAPIVEAGFGEQTATHQGFGTKKWIAGTIVRAGATRTTVDVTSGTQDGEYFGDSGGPVFINMPDGTWRLIGNDLTSPDWNSSGKPRVSTYTSVPYHVAWAEMQSGIDITPCHDANGWNPSASCVGSPINPGEGVGTWATSCAGQTIVLEPTCDGSDGGVQLDASRPVPVPDAASDGNLDATASPEATSSADAHSNDVGQTDSAAAPDSAPGAAGSGGLSGGSSGTAGSSGTPGSAGTYGTAGTGGGASGNDADAVGPGSSWNPTADAGCSCTTAPRRGPTPLSTVTVLACVGGLLRRRKRQRARVSITRASLSSDPA